MEKSGINLNPCGLISALEIFFVWRLRDHSKVANLIDSRILSKAGKLRTKLFSRVLGCVRSNGRTCVKKVVHLIRNEETEDYDTEAVSYLSRVVVESKEGLREFVESQVRKTGEKTGEGLGRFAPLGLATLGTGAFLTRSLRSSPRPWLATTGGGDGRRSLEGGRGVQLLPESP